MCVCGPILDQDDEAFMPMEVNNLERDHLEFSTPAQFWSKQIHTVTSLNKKMFIFTHRQSEKRIF